MCQYRLQHRSESCVTRPVLAAHSPSSRQAEGRVCSCQGKSWLKAWLNKAWLQRWGVARRGIRLHSGRPSEKQAGVHAIPYTAASRRQTGKKKRKKET